MVTAVYTPALCCHSPSHIALEINETTMDEKHKNHQMLSGSPINHSAAAYQCWLIYVLGEAKSKAAVPNDRDQTNEPTLHLMSFTLCIPRTNLK